MSVDWDAEPNLEKLRRCVGLLSSNPSQSLVELKQLAGQGSAMSMYYIGYAYARGNPGPPDPPRAVIWYERAISCGSVRASHNLGLLYRQLHDYTKALAALKYGADKDYAPALNELAVMYFNGEGMPRNPGVAKVIWEKAAQAGHIYSKRNLGLKLLTGQYGMANIPRGVCWLIAAFWSVPFVISKDRFSDNLR